ncbi:uncharacterized protein I303_104836 [Kwoniella dejecticola CBS 10117]|uniref:Uncharacterized protein n=1 Tax=Kwoniella dejecticola CBS 10117 TaxID=1296121 RepID=A0A1A6A477_9TREE|nr:uncharacterized protein I303_04183 [Kwoniella dejecticola CBS 10117]OBR84862.1 hypothetical protein I303_04183 [Kwoniella dejecticola CBS 10117]
MNGQQNSTVAAIPHPPTYPYNWREIINGSLEENFVSIALGSLNELIKPDFIPSLEHIQLLLHLAINPSTHQITPELPLSLLFKLLSCHRSSSLSQALPIHPSSSDQTVREEIPAWLQWNYKRSELHKTVWKSMKRCSEQGIWALLWDQNPETKRADSRRRERGQVGAHEDENDSGDDDGSANHMQLSSNGWSLLEWLVAFWEKDKCVDQNQAGSGSGHSLLFLKQLPRPMDRTGQLPRNDASIPLSILKQACDDSLSKSAESREWRISVAVRLLSLVILTTNGKEPPFHPASLSTPLLHTMRALPLIDVQTILRYLDVLGHWRIVSHTLTLLVEDVAGGSVCTLRDERKNIHFEEDFNHRLNRPTSGYLMKVLLLSSLPRADNQGKMLSFKVALVRIIKAHQSAEEQDKIRRRIRDDSDWWGRFNKVLEQETKGSKAILTGCMESLLS